MGPPWLSLRFLSGQAAGPGCREDLFPRFTVCLSVQTVLSGILIVYNLIVYNFFKERCNHFFYISKYYNFILPSLKTDFSGLEYAEGDVQMENDVVVKIKKTTGLMRVMFISSMTCMLLPLVIISAVCISALYTNVSFISRNNLQQLAVEKMNEVEFVIGNQIQLTKSVAQSPYVQEQVALGSDSRTLTDHLGKINGNAGSLYENFFITRYEEGFADCFGGATLHNVGGEPWYETCKASGEFLGNNISPVTGRPCYVISYALYHDGQFVGGLNNSIDTGNMTKDITGSITEKKTSVLIIDMEGNVIASEDESQILKVNFNQENASTKEVMKQMLGTGKGIMEFDFNGTRNVGAYASVGDMFTVVFMPMSVYSSKVNKIVNSIVIIIIICIAGALLVIFLTSISITRPIKVVNESMQDIAMGEADLTKRIDIKAKYEVSSLVDGFNTFSGKMRNLVTDIKDSTADLACAGEKL